MSTEAVEDAYRRRSDQLVRYATLIVGPDDAADVVIDAMVGVFERHTSPIQEHERGLFASTDLEAGVDVIRFSGRLVSDHELRTLLARAGTESRYVDTIAIDVNRHLVLDDSIARLGNHSCDPLVWLDGPLTLVTRRPIKRGDEITVDYATFSSLPEYEMPCRCGSDRCRQIVTGNDWRLPELQEAYGDRWSPAVLTLIRST